MAIVTVAFLTCYVLLIIFGLLFKERICNFVTSTGMIISIIILVYACLKIRHTIQSLQNPFPNECFIIVHVANFLVYTIVSIIWDVLNNISQGMQSQVDDVKAARQ